MSKLFPQLELAAAIPAIASIVLTATVVVYSVSGTALLTPMMWTYVIGAGTTGGDRGGELEAWVVEPCTGTVAARGDPRNEGRTVWGPGGNSVEIQRGN